MRVRRPATTVVATTAALVTAFVLGATSPGQADSPAPDVKERIKPYGYLQDRTAGFTRIAVPGARVGTSGTDLNDRGQIVGTYDDALPLNQQGYLRSRNGIVTRLMFPGSGFTEPAGINDRGQVVGDYGAAEAAGVPRTFWWEDGHFSRIKVPGSIADGALDLNDRGQIVGVYVGPYLDPVGTVHGYLRTPDGKYRTIEYPGAAASGLVRINDSGQILGRYSEIGTLPNGDLIEPHNFVLDRGVFRELADPPFANRDALAYGLNDQGQIVGSVDQSSVADAAGAAPVPASVRGSP